MLIWLGRRTWEETALLYVPEKTGTMLASAGEDGSVMLWYLGYSRSDKPLGRELRGHGSPVTRIAFNNESRLVSSSGDTAIVWNVVVSGDRPFLSHLSRNESITSSYHDPVTGTTLSLPGIFLTDEDKDACRLVVRAQSAAGRKLTDKEMTWATGGLQYPPTCPRRAPAR